MKNNDPLVGKFKEAVAFVNAYTDPFPADLLLKLYAYYKIANQNFEHPGSKSEIINAFKANALIQAQEIRPKKAMQLYIELVDNQLKNITD
ncbi:MAG: acyl-CoA-binding protein [Eudoraea sp.]|nr:acyl-CoA-binding protein [Eudoraea sp.]